jgi:alanine dehydrogenase
VPRREGSRDRRLQVRVEKGAGVRAGFLDEEYAVAGAQLVSCDDAWSADLVVKVKEPQSHEFRHFRSDLTLFAFLHLAAEPELTRALIDSGVEAHAFETVAEGGRLPVLAPMSEIAGRAAAFIGAQLVAGASGKMLGGAVGVPPANVAVIGLGVAGTMAARGAVGLDASVTGLDVDLARLGGALREGTLSATAASTPNTVGQIVSGADLVIGAALVPGARAPEVLTEEHVAMMRPGSVVLDLAIDQGGCVATSAPTSLSDPTFEVHGVVHYCVTNVPGQFPRTASQALAAVLTPYVARLARDAESLPGSCNIRRGQIVHPSIESALSEAVTA